MPPPSDTGSPPDPQPDPQPDPWTDPDARAERDAEGVLRQLGHPAAPIPYDPGMSDREIALDYLTRLSAADGYGLSPDQIRLLAARGGADRDAPAPPGEGHWYQWLPVRHLPWRDGGTCAVAVVALQQTLAIRIGEKLEEVPIEGAGLRILIHRWPAEGKGDASAEASPWVRAEVASSSSTADQARHALAPDLGSGARLLETEPDPLVAAVRNVMAGTSADAPERKSAVPAPEPAVAHVIRRAAGPGSELTLAARVELMASPTDGRRLAMWPRPSGASPRRRRSRAQSAAEAPAPPAREIGFRAIVQLDGEVPRVVSLQALVASCSGASCTGHAFPRDPMSSTGDPGKLPELPAKELDPLRSQVPIERLKSSTPQRLAGDLVKLASPGPLGILPPESADGSFDHSTRTDDFAAVNAYVHCTRMFAMAEAFGFDGTGYFFPHGQQLPPGVAPQFPVLAVHRAAMTLPQPFTGSAPFVDDQVFTVNAQVCQAAGTYKGVDLRTRVEEMRFALGDLADGRTTPTPGVVLGADGALGVGADARWAWHEFCHALLVAATGSLELPFAHSAGDALAAIMGDPDSEFARPMHGDLRGITFPWAWQPLRRHDRRAEQGWGWHGTLNPQPYPDELDPGGYVAEEILSSTLFRLYGALGGDALQGLAPPDEPARPRRRAAADYVAYLIMRAIGLLGPVSATPSTPEVLAGALMCADAQTGLFTYGGQQRQGGAVRKVIRWAFERQGLYQPPGTPFPRNGPGVPEPVDVFLEDGRTGQYQHVADWQTRPGSIWVRPATGPAGSADTPPATGQLHHVWVRAWNRGSAPAQQVAVTAHAAAGADTGVWTPATWQKLSLPGGGAAPEATIAPGAFADFGPFEWSPNGAGLHAVLVRVDGPGDRSVLYPPSGLACAKGPTRVEDLVPFDNNVGYRSWTLG
jgi:hypothetical protein